MAVIIASVVVFLVLILVLVSILLGAKAKLVPSGPVNINVNGERDLEVGSGGTLLIHAWRKQVVPSFCLWWWWNLSSV